MTSKKVLIQEIESKEFQSNSDKGEMEEEVEQPSDNNQKVHQIVSGTIQTDQNKAVKKDLLRLEKNYFDNIYNEEKHKNEKQFVVSKMISQNPQGLQKPDFRSLPKSSIRDKLNSFMPSFKRDTDDLLVNVERQEQLRIDDRNLYELEQEEDNSQNQSDDNNDEEEHEIHQEDSHNHAQDIIALKKNNKEKLKNKKKNQNLEQDPTKPKMIELDMLLGVLECKDPQENQQIDEENRLMNEEQDSTSTSEMTKNTNRLQKIKIQEISS